MTEIILGKEYIFVPRPEIEKQWGHAHGRTVVPQRQSIMPSKGYIVDLNGPLVVYADELVDPEES